jgi:ubiquitin carboxyl-terminal hydrolase 4/11/15
LGHKGQIATVYADLLHSIYDGNQSSVTPRQFKTTLGRFAPVFAGYGQQDSQEFMSFLADGLHEDLNRIHKKPYLENPDSDDETVRNRAALLNLGQKYRENYEARNSSVITDLFNGFYKNKLVCPECNKVSITFDPYLLLTLQLPMEHHWEFAFTYVPLNGKPFFMYIDNEKGSTIRALKEYAASRTGYDVNKLLMVEVFSHKIYRVMEDRLSIAEANMQQRDDMIIYELEDVPTNYPKRKRSMLDVNRDDQQIDNTRQLVMILHRIAVTSQYNNNPVLWPTFITLSPEEATDYDEVMRKVLRAVSTQTKVDLNEYAASKRSKDEESVEARSVDSEPDYVDLGPPANALEKGAPIPEELSNMFDILPLHWSDPIPTGFGQFDPAAAARSIKERMKVDSESEKSSPESVDVSEESTQEEPDATASYDAESDHLKPGSGRNQRGRKGRKTRARALKVKRNQRPFQKPEPEVADGRFVRTNEILILDWNGHAYSDLFESGREAREKMDVFDDPAKKKRAALREARKRNGISLTECFEETAKEEILTEDNAWYCNRCKKLQLASKQLEIWTAPDILVIHLKRFSSARQFRDKIDVLVDFPVEGLDIKDFVGLDENKDLTYDLFAVDNHYGGIGGGHYTAYAKNFYDNEWYDYNGKCPRSAATLTCQTRR